MNTNRSDRGMVTAELAMSLLGLALATLAALWLIWLLGLQVRCFDTADEIARQLARGDRAAADRAYAGRPAGSSVTTGRDGKDAVVEVRLVARGPAGLPGVPLRARAQVAVEPGVPR